MGRADDSAVPEDVKKLRRLFAGVASVVVTVGLVLFIVGTAGSLTGGSGGSGGASSPNQCTSNTCVTQTFYTDTSLFASEIITQTCDPTEILSAKTTCLNEYSNQALIDSSSGVTIGNVQFIDQLQYDALGALFVVERGNLQFTSSAYPSYISYEYSFNNPSGMFLWPIGSVQTMRSISSSIATPIYIVIKVGKSRTIWEITYDSADVLPPAVFTETKQVNYYASKFQTWESPCKVGATQGGCTIKALNTPLYNDTEHVVGNLMALDFLQKSSDLSQNFTWTSQYVVYQFFDGEALKYLAYNYDSYSSSTGLYIPGSIIDVNAYATGELVVGSNPEIQGLNFALKETLVVSADKRQVTLAYSLVAPTFNPTNAKVVYYDKNAMAISSAPCSQSSPNNCTVYYANAPLYTSRGRVVGNVAVFDLVQYGADGLATVFESGSYQFTASGYPASFSYLYAFESSSGDVVWPQGYRVAVRSVTSSGDIEFDAVAIDLEVGAAVRQATVSW